MAPLILHNVPDDELYIGDDGIQRPYAMVFPQHDGHGATTRTRRTERETGAFGTSSRRSRSKTGTPARREDPTIQSADKVFGSWLKKDQPQPSSTATTPQRKGSIAASASQPDVTGQSPDDDAAATPTPARVVQKVPTEVILRGYKSPQQQYAAISRYEDIAGRVCEDYPRDPPIENRRYKSELRDPAFTRRRALTPEERAKVNRVAGGEHWIKITFESEQAADAAVFASPQSILGCLIFAEPYHGFPPHQDEAVLDATTATLGDELPQSWRRPGRAGSRSAAELRTPFRAALDNTDLSPPQSLTSSRTVESGTVATGVSTLSSATVTGQDSAPPPALDSDSNYCTNLPVARKVKLLPAEQALMPQLSYTQRVLNRVPFLKWFSGSMIGNEVPRTDSGEFDWDKASLYWKLIWWLDSVFGLFRGEILNADKDD
ncbi:Nucleoporin NUP53 [Pleurostoma richardsiae]|uniref:Nucleoporin NUP53 n=1 Tax=Pleurostoma richardsiae TaxID=41990 RepID=A0AA38RQX9_9PEZI|nr:Nucleoporin NUP53 [Pleurostoma richardsiae]